MPALSSAPPRWAPAPSPITPNPPTCSRTRGTSFLQYSAFATTLGSPSRLTHGAGPGALSLPAGRQPGHCPLAPGAASTIWIPNCLHSGVLLRSTPVLVSPRHRLLSSAGTCQPPRLRISGAGGAARGGVVKLGAPSAAGAKDWERALRRAAIRGPASRPPSHRAPTLAGVTVPPPRERWGETVAQAAARAAALQYKDIDHNYFCLFLSLARMLGGGIGTSEG